MRFSRDKLGEKAKSLLIQPHLLSVSKRCARLFVRKKTSRENPTRTGNSLLTPPVHQADPRVVVEDARQQVVVEGGLVVGVLHRLDDRREEPDEHDETCVTRDRRAGV